MRGAWFDPALSSMVWYPEPERLWGDGWVPVETEAALGWYKGGTEPIRRLECGNGRVRCGVGQREKEYLYFEGNRTTIKESHYANL